MKKIINFILIICFAVSCQTKEQKSDNGEIIDAKQTGSEKHSIANIVDSYYIIALETNKQCLIKNIDKICFDKDRIFVMDRGGNNKILIFNKTGEFIGTAGGVGYGPGEYAELSDFCIDRKSREIFLLCQRNKIMRYDYTGQFLESYSLDFFADKMEYSNQHFYFTGYQPDFFNLIVTDNHFKIKHKDFPNADFGKNHRILVHPLNVADSKIQYMRFMDNKIYSVSENKVNCEYAFDFGGSGIPFEAIGGLGNDGLKEKMSKSRCQVKYFTQNGDYAVSYYFDKGKPVINIYNKRLRTATNKFLLNIYDEDFDNYPFLFEYVDDNDDFVAILLPEELVQKTTQYIKNMNLTDDMNPLLYVAKTKH
ncbi:MAG: 6-bladed beta-propeller [Prevotellaceae bacterium]|jgi:hypothetical protein|nr:6-bladed beta-propeller [Prevotellaceae bacterium]